ncbi:MAG: ABC transporter ATP-binding protein [Actinomycetota bacterium]|nr:ABC transporter ATP-binding protein [Actinomycetota bacterium]
MALVIDARAVVKRFGRTVALDGLELTVEQGEVHAFLGPNGAGKTTTIRILLGMLRSDAGHLEVLGMDPWRDAMVIHRRLAYVPGDVSLWPNLTGGQTIDFIARLQGGALAGRRDQLIADFDLDPSRRCRTYSKGNRQKVALVAALATDADLLLLDEPTSGLDPVMEETFRQWVRTLRDEGRTVLLSSHILSEAEALCDRVTILRGGKAVESGRLDELRHLSATTVTATVIGQVPDLTGIPGVREVEVDGSHVSAQVATSALAPVLAALSAAGVSSLTSQPPSLEELFLAHYGDGPRAAGGRDG